MECIVSAKILAWHLISRCELHWNLNDKTVTSANIYLFCLDVKAKYLIFFFHLKGMLYILSVNYSNVMIKNDTRETLAEKGFHQNIQKKIFYVYR